MNTVDAIEFGCLAVIGGVFGLGLLFVALLGFSCWVHRDGHL